MPEPTACEDCDNVHESTRKQSPARWLCIRFPRLEHMNAVAPRQWVRDEPYMRCVGINGGYCSLFTPKRNGQRDNGL
jgi:hypothetical protein